MVWRGPIFRFHRFFGSKVVQKVKKNENYAKKAELFHPQFIIFQTPNYISRNAQKASAVHEIKIKSIKYWQTEKQFGQGMPPNGHLIR